MNFLFYFRTRPNQKFESPQVTYFRWEAAASELLDDGGGRLAISKLFAFFLQILNTVKTSLCIRCSVTFARLFLLTFLHKLEFFSR